jgi:hypothetical protein
MALARVVSFEGVTQERIEELQKMIEDGEQPEGMDASEMMVLYDAGAQKSLAVVFFETEDAYARGDAILNAMPTGDTPGDRTGVSKYEVALRMSS